ncbi:hypothetical protein V8C86DRAFT_793821 [Haematococcus lacustris]
MAVGMGGEPLGGEGEGTGARAGCGLVLGGALVAHCLPRRPELAKLIAASLANQGYHMELPTADEDNCPNLRTGTQPPPLQTEATTASRPSPSHSPTLPRHTPTPTSPPSLPHSLAATAKVSGSGLPAHPVTSFQANLQPQSPNTALGSHPHPLPPASFPSPTLTPQPPATMPMMLQQAAGLPSRAHPPPPPLLSRPTHGYEWVAGGDASDFSGLEEEEEGEGEEEEEGEEEGEGGRRGPHGSGSPPSLLRDGKAGGRGPGQLEDDSEQEEEEADRVALEWMNQVEPPEEAYHNPRPSTLLAGQAVVGSLPYAGRGAQARASLRRCSVGWGLPVGQAGSGKVGAMGRGLTSADHGLLLGAGGGCKSMGRAGVGRVGWVGGEDPGAGGGQDPLAGGASPLTLARSLGKSLGRGLNLASWAGGRAGGVSGPGLGASEGGGRCGPQLAAAVERSSPPGPRLEPGRRQEGAGSAGGAGPGGQWVRAGEGEQAQGASPVCKSPSSAGQRSWQGQGQGQGGQPGSGGRPVAVPGCRVVGWPGPV